MGGIVNESRLGCALQSQKRQAGEWETVRTKKQNRPAFANRSGTPLAERFQKRSVMFRS
jgi:hypothetical protein